MRARNIKPGFFKNEELAECHPLTRILFIGLWCMADKEGRLEKRPMRIKAEILPYDTIDINGELTVLERFGFIQTYLVEGKQYLQVVHFKDHQNPHHTEKGSKIPDISQGCILTGDSPLNLRENPADSLIPDSLITDSLIPEDNLLSADADEQASLELPAGERKSDQVIVPHQLIMQAYNKFCPSLPRAKDLTEKRRALIRLRFLKYHKSKPEGALGVFDALFKRAEASDFLSGRNGQWNGCGFDWLLNEANMVKVLEGNYDNKESSRPAPRNYAQERYEQTVQGLKDFVEGNY